MTTFAQYLRSVMSERNWNQSELARAASISPKNVSEYLNKGVIPRSDRLKAIAEGVGIPLDQVRRAAGVPSSMGEFQLSRERQEDAETLDAAQRQIVDDMIRLLAEGNRKAVASDEDDSTSISQAAGSAATNELEEHRKRRAGNDPEWDALYGEKRVAHDPEPDIGPDEVAPEAP